MQFDHAIAEATQAIFLDANSVAAYALRFECRSLIGDQQGASQDAEELFRIDPTRQVGSTPLQEPSGRKRVPESRTRLATSRRLFEDASELFADDKPVDRSLNLRKLVNEDEVAETLVDASDYRPDFIQSSLPQNRSGRRIKPSSAFAVAMLCVGVGLISRVVWLANRGSLSRSMSSKILGWIPAQRRPARLRRSTWRQANPQVRCPDSRVTPAV